MFNSSLRTILFFLLCSIVPWGNTLVAQAAQEKPAPAEDQKPAAGGTRKRWRKPRRILWPRLSAFPCKTTRALELGHMSALRMC